LDKSSLSQVESDQGLLSFTLEDRSSFGAKFFKAILYFSSSRADTIPPLPLGKKDLCAKRVENLLLF
jgi:hypothetical protein